MNPEVCGLQVCEMYNSMKSELMSTPTTRHTHTHARTHNGGYTNMHKLVNTRTGLSKENEI